jgi:protein phosphatase
MIVELYAKTDVGRVRRANEDNLLVLDLSQSQSWTATGGEALSDSLCRFEVGAAGAIFVVSDGMGGALAGDVASRMAVEVVREWLTGGLAEPAESLLEETGDASIRESSLQLTNNLRTAAEYANLAIHHRSLEDAQCSGMGATFTGAAVIADHVGLVQVGDSRAYILREERIKLATKDQSLVQQLIDSGTLTEEAAETHMFRNVILQALGAQGEVHPATGLFRVRRGDTLLLCSDGLSGKLRAEDMQRIVLAAGSDLAAACDELIREANERGGEDNITVVLARFDGDDLPAPDSSEISVEPPFLLADDDDPTLGNPRT